MAPAKVFIIGAGVAGLQAIATCKRLGAIVEAFDVRPAVKEQVESLGARFAEMPHKIDDAEDAGGYAKEVSGDTHAKELEFIGSKMAKSDVVITTALIPGKPAPVLITRDMVHKMARGSVIVDLAAPNGGMEAVPVDETQRRSPCLSDEELQTLRNLARKVERHYGHAQDIEWAVDRDSAQILLLQSRPETVWSAKDPAPVARAADNPLSHVMSIFGGRR